VAIADAWVWHSLLQELDAWAVAGLEVTLWWRDDDASEPSRALWRLRDVAEAVGGPVTLSVIPARVQPGLVSMVAGWPDVIPVQHGFTHINHALGRNRQAEFVKTRPIGEMIADIQTGDRIMKDVFENRALPVFVPPWNRMPGLLTKALAELGFVGLSIHSPQDCRVDRRSLRALARTAVAMASAPFANGFNGHGQRLSGSGAKTILTIGATIDVIDWRYHRFLGEYLVLDHVIDHLRRRRLGRINRAYPTGLLTHHAVMDADAWRFIEHFVATTRIHPAVRWLTGKQVFGTGMECDQQGALGFAPNHSWSDSLVA